MTQYISDMRNRVVTRSSGQDLHVLDDPGSREVWCPVISVDDHAFEPGTLFDRVPTKHRDDVPKMIDVDGLPAWQIGNDVSYLAGIDGAVGRPIVEWASMGMRLDQYRQGVWDADARVRDMDANGVWASLNFPSMVWGFAGTTLSKLPDREVAYACIKSYNDWIVEDWCGSHPDRFIPCQLPFLADPDLAAEEIRRNAERGVVAVTFSENPHGLGFPSIYSDYWDPFFRACSDTETVINLHVGSSGTIVCPSPESTVDLMTALFPLNGVMACADWIYAKIPIRYPKIKIAMSEAGVSWVPMVIERLNRAYRMRSFTEIWLETDPHPVDLLRRKFWFTSIEDPSAFRHLDEIGEDHVMLEVDYPHPDSSWPDSQELFRSELDFLPEETIRKICFENAAELYHHPLPPAGMMQRSTLSNQRPVGQPVS
jgi:predicted TIM-barrel fold metal-dependent hydrolase